MFTVPAHFRDRPFHRAEALSSGIPRGVLQGPQFRRIHEAVYRHVSFEPDFPARLAAARLALPSGALTTGLTRLQELGLRHGPEAPLHFVVEGDHHLALNGVFLHRTVKLPPNDGGAASDEAAYVAYCAGARTLDAVGVGCWLLQQGRLDLHLLDQLLTTERWRRGAVETAYVAALLDDRCRSMPEAELLTLLVRAGLPRPEVNHPVELAPGVVVTPDLWYPAWRFALEYEGSQHQEDRNQYNADIDRYAAYRRHDVAYELVTKERLRVPRTVVRAVHAALVGRGYDGPGPEFGPDWDALFRPLSSVVGRRRRPER